MSPLSAIIVDDEELSRKNLAFLIENHCSDITLSGIANNAGQARKLILSLQPQVVFLDINMPLESGFDLLDSIKERNFALVFVTAHDQYGIQAIKAGAVDYLLKPLDLDDLSSCINRIKVNLGTTPSDFLLPKSRLAIPHSEGVTILETGIISHLKGEDNYTRVFVKGKEELFVSKPLSKFEQKLSRLGFFRVHKSYLVNLDHVTSFTKKGGGECTLNEKIKIPISRRKMNDFIRSLSEKTFFDP